MEQVVLAIGADHRGFALKEAIKKEVGLVFGVTVDLSVNVSLEFIDCGAPSAERSDYPIYAQRVCEILLSGRAARGVLICGTGAGMAMAANRHRGIYAAVAWNREVARRVREEDHCNVLVLPADYLSVADAMLILREWLESKAQLGRYAERVKMLDKV
ncbi:TPA: ribose-5-phosphate isomerase [Candidatus Dependentiae bacterium]|nr:MAG: Ribose-5-phosphate isomerase B [candidate division TM6 bacterium GW2011_GWF2_43_87]HBL98761.1 ribose-5-phosphate isomerase [Candidatus Dependentiae bacterium]